MKVAVLGAGNGGCGVAFDWAAAGHDVAIYSNPDYPGAVGDIAERGGLSSTGDLDGEVEIGYAGHDAGRAISGADLVFVVGPAYSTEPLARDAKAHLVSGQIVIVCPTSGGGAMVFENIIGRDSGVVVAETSTLPYAVRLLEPATIHVYLKLVGGLWVAATDPEQTDRVQQILHEVYPGIESASSVWQTSLQNANPVIHPSITLLNAARIDAPGDFNFYEDGVTPAVGRLIKGVDDERIALGKAMGVTVLSDPELSMLQGYFTVETYDTGYSTAPGFQGIKAQPQLDYRYFTEDVGYGLVFYSDLGKHLGVPTPLMDSMIVIVSTVLDRDFRGEAKRTVASLGLSAADLTSD
ncbi:MAG: NAD/NADP octopine/nopaline dehydrogenase family protein [Ornithinimicrobium sp.]